MKKVDLRLGTRLSIGKKINEAGRRRINLHDVALALGVTERTVRNWCAQAKKDVPKMGRPSHSPEVLKKAKKLVFNEMKKQGAPGWRPVSAALKEEVSVRLVQKFVAEYKRLKRKEQKESKRMEVFGKNVIWSMDGAITKTKVKEENQVIKDRGTRFWVGSKSCPKASKAEDVIEVIEESIKKNGKPLVIATDNGPALTNKKVCDFLRNLKIVHLRSLPRTPQHNGAVEVGIRELREIMDSKQVKLKIAIKVANARLKKYGRNWLTPISVFENEDVLYNELEHEMFYDICSERLNNLNEQPLNFREKRLKEREIVFEELEKRGLVTKWKMTKNG